MNVTLESMTANKLFFKFMFPDASVLPTSAFALDKVQLYIYDILILQCRDGRYFTTLQLPMETKIPA